MMKQPGGGSIAFCSSAVARHGIPNHEAIAAAKAGVQGEQLLETLCKGPLHCSCLANNCSSLLTPLCNCQTKQIGLMLSAAATYAPKSIQYLPTMPYQYTQAHTTTHHYTRQV